MSSNLQSESSSNGTPQRQKRYPLTVEVHPPPNHIIVPDQQYEATVFIWNELDEAYLPEDHEIIIQPELERVQESKTAPVSDYLLLGNSGHIHITEIPAKKPAIAKIPLQLEKPGKYNLQVSYFEIEVKDSEGDPIYSQSHGSELISPTGSCCTPDWWIKYEQVDGEDTSAPCRFKCYGKRKVIGIVASCSTILLLILSIFRYMFGSG